MHIETIDDDPIRQFNDAEKATLTQNLFKLTKRVRLIDNKTRNFTLDLICDWHRNLFNGVRDHAGRYRSPDYGEKYLNFGPNRSAAREDVPSELSRYVSSVQNLLGQLHALEQRLEPAKFVREVIRAALYLHAELIKLHPFRDGNGRVARLVMTYIFCRFDLPPLIIEVPRQEYISCLNHYFQSNKDIEPLYELGLRIYKNLLL